MEEKEYNWLNIEESRGHGDVSALIAVDFSQRISNITILGFSQIALD
jgi:hypothetical protein